MAKIRMYHCNWLIYLLICTFSVGLIGQAPYQDVTDNSGILGIKGFYGISVGDLDNDTFEDLLFTFIDKPPKIFKNNGDFTFQDITDRSGLNEKIDARTAIWIDYDNDGWLDIFFAGRSEKDFLFHNINGQFIDVSNDMGIGKVSNSFGVNISDIDGNTFPDVYVSNFLEENQLYLNQEAQWMRNRVNFFQLWDSGKSMANILFDYDNDHDEDLYMVHDGNEPNKLYEKQEDGFYLEKAKEVKIDVAAFGMGVDVADINLDGFLDLYITNLYENKLMLNNGDKTFTDISEQAKVNDNGMGWGTTFLDYNNDGYVDIYLCNDSYFSDYPNQLYHNNGDNTFDKVYLENADIKTASYGCVSVDIDHDGKLDLVVANQGKNDRIQILRNNVMNDNHWVGFQLIGMKGTRQAIGARIELIDNDGKLHVDQVTGGNGYSSQGSPIIQFGLQKSQVEKITIYWPGGEKQVIKDLAINNYYVIKEGSNPEFLQDLSTSLNLNSNNDQLTIFPNPTTEYIELHPENDFPPILSIRVISENGKVWNTYEIINKEIEKIMLPHVNGKLYLQLETQKGILTKEIIRIND